MATRSIMRYRAQGDAVLERFGGQSTPASAKAHVKAFKKTHETYSAASAKADDARAERDGKLALVAQADGQLDASIEELAQKCVGAGLGTRQKPLAKFSKRIVSDLIDLPYKKEVDEVLAIADRVTQASPPRDVAAAATDCARKAKALQSALNALIKPQAAYDKAQRERDELLLAWTRAYGRLKKIAAAAWVDDDATFQAVFAPVDAILAPTRKRPKKPTKQPA